MTQWKMKGQYVSNCSCDAGCPCQFNREPTHHLCEGILGMNIVEGYYDDVPLSGLKWAAAFNFPGPLHEGNGTVQPFIDATANQMQREALLQILSGAAGGAWFELIKAVTSKVEEPRFEPIDFQFDMKKRRARVAVSGAVEAVTEPIKNPVTGEEHRAQICLPDGVEFKIAEIGNATVNRSTGALNFAWPNSHSHLAEVEHTNNGLIA